MEYTDFFTFYKLHPDAPNTLYYEHFPEANQATIRSYKCRAKKALSQEPQTKSRDASHTKKSKKKINTSSINESVYNPDLLEMEDIELIRHTCRMIICNSEATFRDRLDAANKLLTLKDKSGTINIEEADEKQLGEHLRKQSTISLVNILKKNSQEEL